MVKKHICHELPFRSKLEMLKDIAEALHCLGLGDRKGTDRYLDDLKARAIFLDEQIQQDVLQFSEQVHFQYDYDPWHKITPDVQRAADRLIESMGFSV